MLVAGKGQRGLERELRDLSLSSKGFCSFFLSNLYTFFFFFLISYKRKKIIFLILLVHGRGREGLVIGYIHFHISSGQECIKRKKIQWIT